MNLTGNALKFTSAGSVELVVKRSDDGLSFEVTDTGIGISEEELARLFQPFVQGDLSTTRRFGGTGLGLAISKQLAELMGGSVHARSVPGTGSTFCFVLPTSGSSEPIKKAPPQTPPIDPPSPAPGSPQVGARPLKLLLAEDSELNRKLALAMLERLGLCADVATNGVEALGALAKGSYDAVLLDVHMPEMDGLEVMRQVRAWAKPQPWLIAISASALPDDQHACFAAGANDFLAKPVKLDALERALQRLISSKAHSHPG
jgi:CheY-like chemotaxis protein